MAAPNCLPGIGCVTKPSNIPDAINTTTGELVGIMVFLNTILKLVFIAAGLYAFFNIIFAGFDFINAAGDPKKVATAWERIYQSVLGLLIIVSSFLLAAILGWILFKDAGAILNPKL